MESPQEFIPKGKVFSEKETDVIKGMFKGEQNYKNLMVLKKAFLPVYESHSAIGVAVDFWSDRDYENMSSHDRDIAILARIVTIKHIERILLMLETMANVKEETAEEQKSRQAKDSAK